MAIPVLKTAKTANIILTMAFLGLGVKESDSVPKSDDFKPGKVFFESKRSLELGSSICSNDFNLSGLLADNPVLPFIP